MKSRTAAATSSGCSCRSMWLPPLISRTLRLGNPFEGRTSASTRRSPSVTKDRSRSPERVVDSGEGATHRCDTLVDEGVGHGRGNRRPRVRDEPRSCERASRGGEDGIGAVHQTPRRSRSTQRKSRSSRATVRQTPPLSALRTKASAPRRGFEGGRLDDACQRVSHFASAVTHFASISDAARGGEVRLSLLSA